MFPIQIHLTPSEIYQAATCGMQRNIRALTRGYDRGWAHMNPWASHIEGAAGELAVAKALGVYWPASLTSFKGADIQIQGGEIEVKLNLTRPDDGDLMVHTTSDVEPHRIYISVLGTIPTFRVMGWIFGWQLLRPEFLKTLKDGGNRYVVPPSALNTFPIPTGKKDDERKLTNDEII